MFEKQVIKTSMSVTRQVMRSQGLYKGCYFHIRSVITKVLFNIYHNYSSATQMSY